MRLQSNRDPRRGDALIIALVGGAVGMILLLALSSSLVQTQKGAKSVSESIDFVDITTRVRLVLSSTASCRESLARSNLTALAAGGLVNRDLEVWAKPTGGTGTLMHKGNEQYSPTLKIESIKFINTSENPIVPTGDSVLYPIEITATKATGSPGGNVMKSIVSVMVHTTSTGLSCSANQGGIGTMECAIAAYGYQNEGASTYGPVLVSGGPKNRALADFAQVFPQGSAPAAVVASINTVRTASQPVVWGAQCIDDWMLVGCSTNNGFPLVRGTVAGTDVWTPAPTQTTPRIDWDIDMSSNGCWTDDDERLVNTRIYMSCCRNVPP